MVYFNLLFKKQYSLKSVNLFSVSSGLFCADYCAAKKWLDLTDNNNTQIYFIFLVAFRFFLSRLDLNLDIDQSRDRTKSVAPLDLCQSDWIIQILTLSGSILFIISPLPLAQTLDLIIHCHQLVSSLDLDSWMRWIMDRHGMGVLTI